MNDSAQIRQVDALIAKMTQEIKDMDSEMKSMETKRIQITNKCKDLESNIEYKNKIIAGKLCEKNILTQRYVMFEKMASDAQVDFENKEAQLEESKHNLWNLRINYTKKMTEFLDENDYLMYNHSKIVEAIQKRKIEKNVEKSISELENEIVLLENEFRLKKSQLDIIEHLEVDKDRLEKEPEIGATYKKLHNQIEIYLKELNRCDEGDELINVNMSMSTMEVEQVRTFTLKVPSKICKLEIPRET